MIKTNKEKYSSISEMKEREKKEEKDRIKSLCEKLAIERYGDKKVKEWSNKYGGIWYLPVLSEDGITIEHLAILKPIDRGILSYASMKISDQGLYSFLEACMDGCWIDGDRAIIDDDNLFIPAANKFNEIIEAKKVMLVKR